MKNKNNKIVCIIQARMGSNRLPQKSLMKLGDKYLVDHVVERALKSELISQVVLAAPKTEENDPLEKRANELAVACFRGSENDLVSRFYEAAVRHKADVVVRVCADNPLIHPSEVDRIIKYYLNSDVDFASNVGPVMGNSYPDGLGAEVFSFEALSWIHNNINDARSREHVHESFYNNPNRFKLGTVMCPREFARPEIVLDINTKEEYNFISRLFNDLGTKKTLISIQEIIPWYEKNYHLIPETYKRQHS